MKLNAIDKTCKALNYLYEGGKLEIDGYTYCMDDNNKVGIEIYDENGNSTGKMIVLDHSLNTFIQIFDKLTMKDIFIMSANMSLQKRRLSVYKF